jgi:hypothetical protein
MGVWTGGDYTRCRRVLYSAARYAANDDDHRTDANDEHSARALSMIVH